MLSFCFVSVYSYDSETRSDFYYWVVTSRGQCQRLVWPMLLLLMGPLCNSGQCNGVHYMLYRCNTVHQTLSQDINITALTFPRTNFIDKFSWVLCVEYLLKILFNFPQKVWVLKTNGMKVSVKSACLYYDMIWSICCEIQSRKCPQSSNSVIISPDDYQHLKVI